MAILTLAQAFAAPTVRAQWDIIPKAALPSWPLWWQMPSGAEISAIPLVWTNEVDGGEEGCCAVGLAARHRAGPATIWMGLGLGTDADGGTPAALEAAVEIEGGAVAFRRLHGRNGVAAFLPVIERGQEGSGQPTARLSAGLSATWIYDERYLQMVPLFECATDAPAVPCRQVATPFAWDPGRDYAIGLEGRLGDSSGRGPRVAMSLLGGLELLDGEHDYLRVEAEGLKEGGLRSARWTLRLAAGWATGDAPLQRRFHLSGADPIRRWLNPYIDAEGALLADVPYRPGGGAGLRAYEETRPLVKRYVAGRAQLSQDAFTRGGFWGDVSVFLEGAWTPNLPERFGPEVLDRGSPLLFDWRELPTGEGEAGGEFMARVLELSELWADAGLALTGGYRRFAVTLAVPFWASEPALANEPLGGGEAKAFAFRWIVELDIRHGPVGAE